ncbi:MAG: sulfotransferase [Myxococcales bacterium]|nr:sulfotransferase [Myxococcales bacterium]
MKMPNDEETKQYLAENLFSPLNGMTVSQWGNFLRQYGSQIHMRYLARTLFGSGMAMINSVAALVETLKYREAVRKATVRAPIFVLGHYRSGTTHLWNILSCDPQFAYPSILQAVFPNSFLVFERIVHGPASGFTISKRPQDNVEIDPSSPIEDERALCAQTLLSIQMVRHFPQKWKQFKSYLTLKDSTPREQEIWKDSLQRFAKKLMVRYGDHKRLLFKSPDHTGKIRYLLEVFPDAKFIHIHRDPWLVFSSTQRMEEKTAGIYAFQPWKNAGDREAFILWRYRSMYSSYEEDARKLSSEQLVEVGYDDLVRNPLAVLEKIYSQLGINLADEARLRIQAYMKRISGYKKNHYHPLPKEVQQRVVEAWSPYFDRWGYSTKFR